MRNTSRNTDESHEQRTRLNTQEARSLANETQVTRRKQTGSAAQTRHATRVKFQHQTRKTQRKSLKPQQKTRHVVPVRAHAQCWSFFVCLFLFVCSCRRRRSLHKQAAISWQKSGYLLLFVVASRCIFASSREPTTRTRRSIRNPKKWSPLINVFCFLFRHIDA